MARARRFDLVAFAVVCIAASGCGGGEDDAVQFPLVTAPLDTVGVVESTARPDTGVVATAAEVDLARPEWENVTMRGYPPPKELEYIRYENPAYGYSLAYPDTLFGPVQTVGEGRGMEFSTSDSTSRILVFADEESSQDDFEEQYQSALLQPEGRVMYRARESSWYIVSGLVDERVFYEKSVLSDGVLRTLRVEYPADRRAYFDAVTAVMSASFD